MLCREPAEEPVCASERAPRFVRFRRKAGFSSPQGLLLGTLTVLSRLRVSPKTFVLAGRLVNGRCVKQTGRNRTQPSCTRPVNLSVSYRLNMPAGVTITIKRVLPGRLNNRRCVVPTRNNRAHRRCTRRVALRGTLANSARQGANSFTWGGRIGDHKLAAGTYQLIATPSFGGAQTVTFRIGELSAAGRRPARSSATRAALIQ